MLLGAQEQSTQAKGRGGAGGGWLLPALCLTLWVLVCGPVAASAQTTSTVEGRVADQHGLPIAGVRVDLVNPALSTSRSARTDDAGFFRLPALDPGQYVLTASRGGFATRRLDLWLPLNYTLALKVALDVGPLAETQVVGDAGQAGDLTSSSTGLTVGPRQLRGLPLHGRNYLDLMQLAPGVAANRHADAGSDAAVAVLGERGGNTLFLVDGMSNQNAFGGGAAAQFSQDAIAEFQLISSGWKAEFGRGSGGVVNVITRGGTDDWQAALSLFQRHSGLDSANVDGADAPFLRRQDYGLNAGGPLRRGRAFAFASFERVAEERQLNFVFPPGTPAALRDFERGFDRPSRERRSLAFVRLDEHAGRHHLTQSLAWTSGLRRDFLPLSQATDLPSTRQDFSARSLSLGFGDTILLGRGAGTGILSARVQFRREPTSTGPSHPEAGPATLLELFSDSPSGSFFGDLGQFTFGSSLSPSHFEQSYDAADVQVAFYRARHQWKFGGSHTRMRADGTEAALLLNQLFTTASDLATFGPVNAGFFSLRTRGGSTPSDSLFRLRNSHTGLFLQDDLRLRPGLTLNLGLRWDYDSRFPSRGDFAPRLGFAFAAGPRTVVRAGWGVFYDRFRLGLARDVPEFGGARVSNIQPVSYPRLFYGVPTIAPIVFGLCLSPTLTGAQVDASGASCPFGPEPLLGVDTLNRLVAPGRDAIPANVAVSIQNVTALSGLSPQEFADRASAAVGRPQGFFFWGPFGVLTHAGSPLTSFPVTLDRSFRTPHTRGFHLGVEHEFSPGLTLGVEYFHRDIRDLVGMRLTNIPFEARLPGLERRFDPPSPEQEVRGLGSWFAGRYDALSLNVNGRLGQRLVFGGSYTYARARDNARCSNLTTGLVMCAPSDSFVGLVPRVTDPATGRSNDDDAFVAANGNPVPRAGTFHNGADYDRGPSDLALDHTLAGYGLLELPSRFTLSTIFRFQSGFHFSRQAEVPVDVDGDLNFNAIDHARGRNAFTAPPLINVDLRAARSFALGERVRVLALVEFFNLFNNRNAAAVETAEGRPTGFGRALQHLPGREGQVGLRIQF